MDSILAVLAAIAATAFSIDLWLDYRRKPRPHIAAYATGITMFAIATWALFVGLTFGWTGPVFRTYYLFGAVLNILFLALGSMFLVGGRKAGHVMAILLGAIAAISTTLVATVPFATSLPESGVPERGIFESGFGPRMFAAIGGGVGTTILVVLALVSVYRFWNKDRNIVWGNLLIVGGTAAAASGGTALAFGEGAWLALSLLVAVTLIWWGYRVASGGQRQPPNQPPI